MPLKSTEIEKLEELLVLLSEEDIKSIFFTVLKNQIEFTNYNDAIKNIIKYTDSPLDLLKRKKLRRDFLFQYCHKFSIGKCLPKDTKYDLIKKILDHWGSVYNENEMEIDDEWNEEQNLISNQESFSQNQISSFTFPPQLTFQPKPQINQQLNHSQFQHPTNNLNNFNNNDNNNNLNIFSNIPSNISPTEEDFKFASEFCVWFFQKLQRSNIFPNSESFQKTDFDLNCTLKIILNQNQIHNKIQVESNEEVLLKLIEIGINFTFIPNFDKKGISAFSDQFGRKIVYISGLVKTKNQNSGLFETQFGLFRSEEQIWMLKFINLIISFQNNNLN